jgi:hypothetical protein
VGWNVSRIEEAWLSRSERAAMAVHCRMCREQLGYVTDTAVGPLLVMVPYFRPATENERRRLADRKAKGMGWTRARPVEKRLLDEWHALAVRCRCGRGRFIVDETILRDRWQHRRRHVSV